MKFPLKAVLLFSLLFFSWIVIADTHDEYEQEEGRLKGVHNGRLLDDENFVVELAIYEQGVAPEFRAWAREAGKPINPENWTLDIQLTRLGGKPSHFTFVPEQDFLRGQNSVEEPHSFDVEVTAMYRGQRHHWSYPSYEGRLNLAPDIASASGITTAVAGAGVVQDRIKLYGNIVVDPLRISHIQARYPGLICSVKPTIGTPVKAGDIIAVVEYNESLQDYPLSAPIDGVVVERHANPGEFTGDRVLFTILDSRVLELHLHAFPAEAHKIKSGQTIHVQSDNQSTQTHIEYITPRHGETPTLEVHAFIDNQQGLWVPNQTVEGWIDIAQTPVALRVDNRALQSFREWQVVFIKLDNTYEIRPLELGRTDGQFTEVLSGLNPGDTYVVENSYLLKADLEKSGAAHEH